MIRVDLSPSGRRLQLELGPHRGQMTWRDVNDRAKALLTAAQPVAFLVRVPDMPRAREFADMMQALPAIRAVLVSVRRVAIVTDTPPVDCLSQLRDQFPAQDLRLFSVAEERRAVQWLDASPAAAKGLKAAASEVGASEQAADSDDGVYHLGDESGEDSDIDDWFVKS